MSEITLSCEISNSDEEITFEEYREIRFERKHEMGLKHFSMLMESCGDSEAIEDVFGEKAHTYYSGELPAALLMNQIDNPSWETILWGQSFAKKDGQCDGEAVEYVVNEYDAEDFDLE